MSIGGIVGIGGMEQNKNEENDIEENANIYSLGGYPWRIDVKAVSQHQQEVVDFYYKIKEFFMNHSELCGYVPTKRTTWVDVSADNDTDDDNVADVDVDVDADEWRYHANTDLNLKISDAIMSSSTKPIPIPLPSTNLSVWPTGITEPKN
jgi:hypothetical protein